MQIYDWYANSQKILKNGCYTTKNQVFNEQIHLVKYLMDQYDNDVDAVFDIWRSVPSDYTETSNERELKDWFNKVLAKAKQIKKLEPSNKIWICQSEIEYINSLQVYLYFKKFLLLLLAYSRIKQGPYVMWDLHIKNELLRRAGVVKVNTGVIEHVAKWNQQYHLFETIGVISKRANDNSLTNVVLHYDIGHKEEANFFFEDLSDVSTLFPLLKDIQTICPVCGKKFEKGSKSKTDLCPDCYKKHRRSYNTKLMQTVRQRKTCEQEK